MQEGFSISYVQSEMCRKLRLSISYIQSEMCRKDLVLVMLKSEMFMVYNIQSYMYTHNPVCECNSECCIS